MEQSLIIKSKATVSTVALTDLAIVKVRELIQAENDPDLALRVAVRPGGCSGFSYEMFFDTQVEDGDIVEMFGPEKDVKVVVDPQSAKMVQGATLDYKDGLMGAGFSINNPNVNKSCGCGNSFS